MKKLLIAIVLGGGVFASVFALAASLGLDTDDLGAGDDIVSSCAGPGIAGDTPGADITVTYETEFDTTDLNYQLTDVTIHDLTAACVGQAYKITIVKNDGSIVEHGDAPVLTVAAAGDLIEDFSGDNIKAEDVKHVAVVITGDQP